MDILNITPEIWLQNEDGCLESLNQDQNWNKVLLLNVNDLDKVQDKTLVRFRGMVQDMFNPEYYHEQYEVVDESTKQRYIRTSKYTDTPLLKENEAVDEVSDNNVTKQRLTLVVISPPALNEWVLNVEAEQDKIITPTIETTSLRSIKKRNLEEDEHMEVEETSRGIFKRRCRATNPCQPSVSGENIFNFPLPSRPGKACHVKVYKDTEKIKLNDMIEAIGFLSVDPTLGNVAQDGFDSEMEIQTHNPPPSLIPRIHCVAWKRLEHNNPLVRQEFDCAKIQNLKKELHLVLTQLFMGDTLAAEYFIYHLISRVYLRADLLPLGKFTLNISHIPAEVPANYGQLLYNFIELLVPKSHYLPMSLENMNTLSFTPKKDYECDRITSGLLQLSKNTHLVLDETKLTPGQLNASGVKGMAALASAIKAQKNAYDFNYFQMEYDCDIAFLILSEGKSLLPSDVHVSLKPDEVCVNTFAEIAEAAHHFLKCELLDDVRVYLTLARHGKYELPDAAQEMVQNEFVQMRQEKPVTVGDFHQLLVVARLICLSEGKPTLDAESWKRARELEEERKKRLA